MFWSYGKIHGLENIAYLDDEKIKELEGDPWRLQIEINKVNDMEKPLPP